MELLLIQIPENKYHRLVDVMAITRRLVLEINEVEVPDAVKALLPVAISLKVTKMDDGFYKVEAYFGGE